MRSGQPREVFRFEISHAGERRDLSHDLVGAERRDRAPLAGSSLIEIVPPVNRSAITLDQCEVRGAAEQCQVRVRGAPGCHCSTSRYLSAPPVLNRTTRSRGLMRPSLMSTRRACKPAPLSGPR